MHKMYNTSSLNPYSACDEWKHLILGMSCINNKEISRVEQTQTDFILDQTMYTSTYLQIIWSNLIRF